MFRDQDGFARFDFLGRFFFLLYQLLFNLHPTRPINFIVVIILLVLRTFSPLPWPFNSRLLFGAIVSRPVSAFSCLNINCSSKVVNEFLKPIYYVWDLELPTETHVKLEMQNFLFLSSLQLTYHPIGFCFLKYGSELFSGIIPAKDKVSCPRIWIFLPYVKLLNGHIPFYFFFGFSFSLGSSLWLLVDFLFFFERFRFALDPIDFLHSLWLRNNLIKYYNSN